MNKPKAQGTREETWIVNRLQDEGLLASRLAEGGSCDRGDVHTVLTDGSEMIIEAKARERLSVHTEVAKAGKKASPLRSVVVWKRLVKQETGKRRSPVGATRVVSMDWETFVSLITRR